ncbi:hypothetical protein ILUMI_07527 [Ignelater luminosus]|uniref:Uncharacterized protein n=1 Tax=Ignelater luminosus TaxID=2038154 RepID=A0A8K0D855_IGNLU|nr:hypothetical protein ILUMI_07527 [Ignelater luminosus]
MVDCGHQYNKNHPPDETRRTRVKVMSRLRRSNHGGWEQHQQRRVVRENIRQAQARYKHEHDRERFQRVQHHVADIVSNDSEREGVDLPATTATKSAPGTSFMHNTMESESKNESLPEAEGSCIDEVQVENSRRVRKLPKRFDEFHMSLPQPAEKCLQRGRCAVRNGRVLATRVHSPYAGYHRLIRLYRCTTDV